MSKVIRFIGDVHGDYTPFLQLYKDPEVDYIVQVGDLGFNYKPLTGLDPDRIRCLAGNHDCYERDSPNYFKKQPFFLGDYGSHFFDIGEVPAFFYVRGAWSIDHKQRQAHARRGGPVSWWEEEELEQGKLEDAIQQYDDARPRIVVTHECPMSIVQYVTNPKFCEQFGYPAGTIETRTNKALQAMLNIHQPEYWVFGHYHTAWDRRIEGTHFVCLDMVRKNTVGVLDLEV